MRRDASAPKDEPGASKVDVEIPACVEFGTRAPSDDGLPFNFAPRIELANYATARFIGAALTNSLINQPDHQPSIWHQSPVPSHLPYCKHFGNNPVTFVQASPGYPPYPLISIQMLNDLPSAPQVPFLFGS